jgi:hypothetical protein
MNVRLHIDRLVLEGLDVAHGGHGALQAAVESEISRLIGAQGISAGISNVPRVTAPSITARPTAPEKLGTDIGGAVYQGIRNAR